MNDLDGLGPCAARWSRRQRQRTQVAICSRRRLWDRQHRRCCEYCSDHFGPRQRASGSSCSRRRVARTRDCEHSGHRGACPRGTRAIPPSTPAGRPGPTAVASVAPGSSWSSLRIRAGSRRLHATSPRVYVHARWRHSARTNKASRRRSRGVLRPVERTRSGSQLGLFRVSPVASIKLGPPAAQSESSRPCRGRRTRSRDIPVHTQHLTGRRDEPHIQVPHLGNQVLR